MCAAVFFYTKASVVVFYAERKPSAVRCIISYPMFVTLRTCFFFLVLNVLNTSRAVGGGGGIRLFRGGWMMKMKKQKKVKKK